MSKKQELMKPRYKVIAKYPHMEQDQVGVGDIISPYGMGFMYPEKVMELYDSCPANFRRLQWWEERKPEEMPEYVIYKFLEDSEPKILRVQHHFKNSKFEFNAKGFLDMTGDFRSYSKTTPATETEYLNYINFIQNEQ